MRLILIVTLVLIGEFGYAAGGEHGAIPWKTIIAQAVNVTIAIGILIYFLRDKVKDVFVGRVDKFDEEFRKAQAQKKDAESKRNEIKKRLEKLKITADRSIQDSKGQAKKNTIKLLQETDLIAKRIVTDSEGKVQNQLNKIVSELKTNILKQSFDKARDNLSDNISQPELKRLKDEFIKNIEVMQ